MPRPAADYLASMRADLPTGPAWPRDRDGALEALLTAVAEELSLTEGRAERLQEEADPRAALEMLPDWERVLGLPDPCLGPAPDLGQRRESAHDKETAEGTLTVASYVQLCARLGYTVTVVEFRPFRAGRSRCGAGHRLGAAAQVHTLRVRIAEARTLRFRAGRGRCGRDPLRRVVGADPVMCAMRRERPAHVELRFTLPEEA